MIYKIPGTIELYIDRDFTILDEFKKPINSYGIGELVTISMYNKIRTVKKSWLYWMARYNLDLPAGKRNAIFSFEFHEIEQGSKITSDTMAVSLKHPIDYVIDNTLFKTIPRHPMYAISNDGILYDLKKGCISNNKATVSSKEYPTIRLNVGHRKHKLRALHRLIAMAWCKNDDYCNNIIVNHIDGDKYNYYYTNLEWTTTTKNTKHAVDSGLRSDNIKVKTKNIETGVVAYHTSTTDVAVYIGRSRVNLVTANIVEGKIWSGSKGNFEMKYHNDETPWTCDKNPTLLHTHSNRFIYNVQYNDKQYVMLRVTDLESVIPEVHYKSIIKYDIGRALTLLSKRIPELTYDIDNKYNKDDSDYLCKNLTDDTITILKTRSAISELTGGSKSTIQKSIRTDGAYSVDGKWVIKYNNGKEWAPLAEIQNVARSIEITDSAGIKHTFKSMREASVFLGLTRKTISKIITQRDGVGYGYNIKEV